MWINIYIAKKSRNYFSDGQIFTNPNIAYEKRVKGFEYVKTSKIV